MKRTSTNADSLLRQVDFNKNDPNKPVSKNSSEDIIDAQIPEASDEECEADLPVPKRKLE